MMKIGWRLLCLLIVLVGVCSTTVTLDNLKGFFWATYDRNNDGVATIPEFLSYFRFMEP